MRRLRRRRPAGEPQVPIEVVDCWVGAPLVGPAVVRIGPDRTLLDPPWESLRCTVAHVWSDDRLASGWARVEWPVDVWSHRPIAPLDLHLGHVLEFALHEDGRWCVRYAVVADVTEHRVVFVPAASALDAVAVARRAIDVWRTTELAATAESWLERFVLAEPQYWSS